MAISGGVTGKLGLLVIMKTDHKIVMFTSIGISYCCGWDVSKTTDF